jgi:anti-anti-sigma factor
MSSLMVTVRDAVAGPVLRIIGSLDYATVSELRAVVDRLPVAAGQLLVLDLGGLEFCDSSGIAGLLAARNLTIEKNGDLALAAVPANTARILRFVGLDRVFTIHPDTGLDNPLTDDRSST